MKAVVALAALLAGCGQMGYQGMSAEQIAATAKMKDANVNCVIGNTPWGRVVSTFVNVDKGVVYQGAISVDGECRIQYNNSPPPVIQHPANPTPPVPPQ